MFDAIKNVTDDNFVFQQDSAPAHYMCNTDQLLQWKIFILSYSPQWLRAEPQSLQDANIVSVFYQVVQKH